MPIDPATTWSGALASSDFPILVLGTSISWGQGLAREHKFPYLFAQQLVHDGIARRPVICSYAHSGAKLWDAPGFDLFKSPLVDVMPHSLAEARAELSPTLPGRQWAFRNDGTWRGECPGNGSHVWLQAVAAEDRFRNEKASPRVVLLDAGANDIGVFEAIALSGAQQKIARATKNLEHCLEYLVQSVQEAFPRADILVGSYYRAISEQTDYKYAGGPDGDAPSLRWFLPDMDANLTPDVIERWAASSEAFERLTREWVVRELARTEALPYSPRLGDNNALWTKQACIWGPNRAGVIKDEARAQRQIDCTSQVSRAYAAIAHPNRAGAQKYADNAFAAYLRAHPELRPVPARRRRVKVS